MSPVEVERAIDAIMKRKTGASGTAVFVDPVILRYILEGISKP